MAKLGYTWYPKDWGNSDSVFELSLSERGLYREFIDFAMLNDNKTELKKDVWVRKFSVSMNELNLILDKLLQSLIVSKINYNDLITGDKNAILFAARILGYGANYDIELTDKYGKRVKTIRFGQQGVSGAGKSPKSTA